MSSGSCSRSHREARAGSRDPPCGRRSSANSCGTASRPKATGARLGSIAQPRCQIGEKNAKRLPGNHARDVISGLLFPVERWGLG